MNSLFYFSYNRYSPILSSLISPFFLFSLLLPSLVELSSRLASFNCRYIFIAFSLSSSSAAFWAIDKVDTIVPCVDLGGAFFVARVRVGGAIATSCRDVRIGRVSNSVFRSTSFPLGFLPRVGVATLEDVLVRACCLELSGADASSVMLFWAFLLAAMAEEDFTAARTPGLKSASILLKSPHEMPQ